MSCQLQDSTSIATNDNTDETTDFALAPMTSALVKWLDEQPHFISVEVTKSVDPFETPSEESRVYEVDERSYRTNFYRDVTEQHWLHPQYDIDTRACYNSQAEVRDAWEDGKFPKHRIESVDDVTGAYLYSRSSRTTGRSRRGVGLIPRNRDTEPAINYDAVQHHEGHGAIMHYSTLAAIRTKTGLVINNEQDYGLGPAHVTQPTDADHELPLTGIKNVLSGKRETVYDIVSVQRDMTRIQYTTTTDLIGNHDVVTGVRESRTNDRQVTRIDLTTGAAVILLHDSTANDPDETKCGFYLPPEEATVYDGAQGALDALQPIDVMQAKERGMDIVEADKYAGNGAHGFHNESILGDAIIRQGEWYLIPMSEDWTPNKPTYKPLPVARNSDWDFSTTDSTDELTYDDVIEEFPEGCPDCGATSFEISPCNPKATCKECAETYIFSAHDPADYIKEEVYERYEDALDTLDSHTPRDLAVTEDGIYVRGTFRHTDNEHKMVNLRERWHLAVENTRDVTVFDLGIDGGGVARFE